MVTAGVTVSKRFNMDTIITSVFNTLINQGLSGIVIAGLIWVVYTLWMRQEKLQDQRIEELRALMHVVSSNTIAIEKNTIAVDNVGDIVRRCPK